MNTGSQFVMEGVKNLVLKQHVSKTPSVTISIPENQLKQWTTFTKINTRKVIKNLSKVQFINSAQSYLTKDALQPSNESDKTTFKAFHTTAAYLHHQSYTYLL